MCMNLGLKLFKSRIANSRSFAIGMLTPAVSSPVSQRHDKDTCSTHASRRQGRTQGSPDKTPRTSRPRRQFPKAALQPSNPKRQRSPPTSSPTAQKLTTHSPTPDGRLQPPQPRTSDPPNLESFVSPIFAAEPHRSSPLAFPHRAAPWSPARRHGRDA
ncbi:hypothetical protein EJ04DRAFT_41564 [Polyplosphaeria fusca]|uniref:Uncharacterized protein n=1 Tax=Polyplosphaeria fusca TaxID=682080 RepID=A0A9P4V6S5_9PLEO|nr:hypothetical protein EJ04DRAFT_41564 [Polyplosphaeria fusca]